MPSKRKSIRKNDARVILSDVLPYELPPSYSNRGFYDFLCMSGLRATPDGLFAKRLDDDTESLLQIVLGREVRFPTNAKNFELTKLDLPSKETPKHTIPFQYTIRHRSNDYRTLTIPHPAAQFDIVGFYATYADLILYYTSKSRFSLRRPRRVAPYSIVRDWLFEQRRRDHDSVERDGYEYEWLRSYFTYSRYSNVYKFYDSKEYRSCERRFGYLVKADVAKCFDSIYTHSIAWAAHGHDVVKANLATVKDTFGGAFDSLMQRLNHSETSGITIGSEVSRIFAEVILQAVDLHVARELESYGLVFGEDYEILRYVDDYFVFLADANDRTRVIDALARNLRIYKLHLNAAKEEGKLTPWLSPLTVAKQRLSELLRKAVRRGEAEDGAARLPRPYVDAAGLITGYKAILLDTGVGHFELANYSLARAERSMEKLVRSSQESGDVDVSSAERTLHLERLSSALLALLDFVFFVFSGAPRMSPAVKVARITSSVLRFARDVGVPVHSRERIEMRIRDEIVQQLRRSAGSSTPDTVTATLLDSLSDLGSDYMLEEEELAKMCGFGKIDGTFTPPPSMNVLLLFSLVLHMKDSRRYRTLRGICEEWILGVQTRPMHDAERAILNLNVLMCRYITRKTRSAILASYGVLDTAAADRLVRPQSRWNVDWERFDLYAALQRKRLHEVY